MDQVKIGKFIAECRRGADLTQAQLADKLGITDKAISKWERGISMPDSGIMLQLCELLGITVNELLSAKRIDGGREGRSCERLLVDMSREIERKNKMIWSSMWVIMAVSITALIAGLLISSLLIPEGPWQVVAMLGICFMFLIPCFYALKLEVCVGAYRCKRCGCEIVPTYKQALNAMHSGTTRYLKCPRCEKRTWCKKVISRDGE